MHLQHGPLQSYFAYVNSSQLGFGEVLTYLCWSIKESTSQFLLSITLFDLDEGTGNCINVTVESPCPLVISNLINPEQRDISRDLALENGTQMRLFYDYEWKGWSGPVFPLQVASGCIHPAICPFHPFVPFSPFSSPVSPPPHSLRISINLFRIPVCTYQNIWKKFSYFHFSHDK